MQVIELLEDDKNYYVVQEMMKGGELAGILSKQKTLNAAYVANLLE